MAAKKEVAGSKHRIQISSGREVYAPIPYHTFEVGPVSVDLEVDSAEALEDALKRGQDFVNVAIQQQFEEKLTGFFERIGQLDAYMVERGMATRAQSNAVRPTSSQPAPIETKDLGPENEAGFRGDPTAGPEASASQFSLLRKLGSIKGVDVDSECERIFGIGLDQISKPAMSKFLDYVNGKPDAPAEPTYHEDPPPVPGPSSQEEPEYLQQSFTAEPEKPAQQEPQAVSIGDLVSAKQLAMIRSMAREKKIDAEAKCQEVFGCAITELSKRAASKFIDALKIERHTDQEMPPALASASEVSDTPF